MSAAALIENLQRRGFTLVPMSGSLRIMGPPGTITPALQSQLAANKEAILAVLDPPPPPPVVICADCRHFAPDAINPAEGIGACTAGQAGLYYPRMKRPCSAFQITRSALDLLAQEVSRQPQRFAEMVWQDGVYDQPHHIRRLAERIEQVGFPNITDGATE